MSSIPLPALYIRPPQQQEDPLTQATRLVQLRSLLNAQPYQQQILQQQAQAAALENQQRQIQMRQQQGLSDLFARGGAGQASLGNDNAMSGMQASGPRETYQMPSDEDIMAAGGPILGTQILKNFKQLQRTNLDLRKAALDHQSALYDLMGNAGYAIQKDNYNPDRANMLLDQTKALMPELAQRIEQIQANIRNPALLKQMVDGIVTQSVEQRKVAAQETAANARKQQADIAAWRAGMSIPGTATDQPAPQTSQPANGQSETTGDSLNINYSKNRLNIY